MGVDAASFQTDVTVVIPTFNHARFLGEAIKSVLAQTRQVDEIIVVDDGSTDDPATVVSEFPAARLIRQENRGLSAARNTGLRNCKARYVIFLDADDRLRPNAVEAGLNCITSHPECAFVYGGHCRVSEDGHPLGPGSFMPVDGDAHLALTRWNLVGPPVSVLFRRECLLAVNGFDETLRRCEDYDIYLRLAQKYPIGCHPTIVAEYRRHGQNMSNNYVEQLATVLEVLDRHEARVAANPLGRTALQEGRANLRSLYVSRMLDAASVRWRARHNVIVLLTDLIEAARWSPSRTASAVLSGVSRRVGSVLGLKQTC
jgi:glycosyltransferase involved in cell wall biosynthesis